jgi:hypothetical protein
LRISKSAPITALGFHLPLPRAASATPMTPSLQGPPNAAAGNRGELVVAEHGALARRRPNQG